MQERVQRGFNRLSPVYDAAAFVFFGRSLWRAQSHYLEELPRCHETLIIGGGTGKILEEMIRLGISDRYYYLDISDEMTNRARKRVERKYKGMLQSITFHTGTIRDVKQAQFDLLVTPFVLDIIDRNELAKEMEMMSDRLSTGGLWLFTDFNLPRKKGLARVFSSFIISFLYFFFTIFTGIKNSSLPGFEKIFFSLGFEIQKESYFLGQLLVTRIYKRKE